MNYFDNSFPQRPPGAWKPGGLSYYLAGQIATYANCGVNMTSLLESPPTEQLLPTAADESLFVTVGAIPGLIGVSESTFQHQRAVGRFGPRPIRGFGRPKFLRVEVVAWANTTAPNGNLYDAQTWPPVWESIKRAREKAGQR